MRQFALVAAGLVALLGPSIAADMRAPVRKAPPPVAPAWNWTGCYVGGHAGWLWSEKKDWTVRTPGGAFAQRNSSRSGGRSMTASAFQEDSPEP